MRKRILGSRFGWSVVVATSVVVLGLFVAASVAEAKGENVTFINKSRQTQQLLTAFGGEGACSEMPNKENLKIESGEQMVLESGPNKVCWCAGSGKMEVTQCGEWKKAKAGSKVRITF